MANSSTVQDDGSDATLARWPASYGGTVGNVVGAIEITGDGSGAASQYSAISTDKIAAPLVLDRIDCQIKCNDGGSDPGASFSFDLPGGDGNRLAWERSGGAWRFLQQTGYGDNFDPSAPVTVSANTYISLAIAVGANAARYGQSNPLAGYVYAFYSTNGGTSWQRPGTVGDLGTPSPAQLAPAGYTAGSISVNAGDTNNDGPVVVTVDNINLQAAAATATVPGIPGSLNLTRSIAGTTVTIVATWTPPDSNGGSALTGYSIDDGTGAKAVAANVTTYTFTKTQNIDYTISLQARNVVGLGTAITRTSVATVVAGLSELADLSDNFDDNALGAPWSIISDGMLDQSGKLYAREINENPKYLLARGVFTRGTIGFQFPNLSQLGLAVGDTIGIMVRSTVDPTQIVRIFYRDGVLTAEYQQGAVDPLAASVPYDFSKHEFLFIGAGGGKVQLAAGKVYAPALRTFLNRTNFDMPAWSSQDVQGGIFVVNSRVAAPTSSKPSIPLNVVGQIGALGANGYSATLKWAAPASDGGSPITSYTWGRDGVDSGGYGEYYAPAAQPGTFTLANLSPGSTYHFSVYATNANGNGPTATVTVTMPTAGTVTPPNPSGYDWTSHFSTKTLFLNDWYPTAPYALGGSLAPQGSVWQAGPQTNAFDPIGYIVDASAPAGEYVQLTCRPTPVNEQSRSGGAPYYGCNPQTKRSFKAVGGAVQYVEFCARFPVGFTARGMFPALWLYGSIQNYSGTDNTGAFTTVAVNRHESEMDCMEIFGNVNPMRWAVTTHSVPYQDAGPYPNQTPAEQFELYKGTVDNNWHTYGVCWDGKTRLEYYFDRGMVVADSASNAARFDGIEMNVMMDYVVTNGFSWAKGDDGQVNNYAGTPAVLRMDVTYVRHWVGRPF